MVAYTKPFIKHADSPRPIRAEDLLVVNKQDYTTPSGFRTANASVPELNELIVDGVRNGKLNTLVKVDTSLGLAGDGSVNNPLSIDLTVLQQAFTMINKMNISQVGRLQTGSLPIMSSGWNVMVTADIPLFLAGMKGVIPSGTTIDIRQSVLNPTNKTLYLYACAQNSQLRLVASDVKRPESYYSTWVGNIKTNAISITGLILSKPFMRLGNDRLSSVAIGSGIPVSDSNTHPFKPATALWSV